MNWAADIAGIGAADGKRLKRKGWQTAEKSVTEDSLFLQALAS